MRTVKNYVDGHWITVKGAEYIDVENPSTGAVIGRVPLSGAKDVDRALEAADRAFPEWAATPVSQRVRPLFKLAWLLRENETGIARTIAEEMGKSLPDAVAELKRVHENIEVACGMPMLQQGNKLVESAKGIDGEVINLPLGVFTMIAPFNFPAMCPFWFLPYAIAAGNTFVLKASKQVPLTMQVITGYIDQIGLPPGVFNLVNGDRAVAERFLESPLVKGVSLVGSTAVCKQIALQAAKTNKRFQAMGGAKNHLVAMPDANLENMIRNMVTSCYGCAGQRCMASSAIIAVGDAMYEQVIDRFVAESRNVIVADPLDPAVADEPMVMGPVISAKAKAFIHKMIETGVREGATLALDGRDIRVPGCEKGYFVGPTVFTDVKPGMQIHETEIFGPVVVILKAGSLDEAIGIINRHKYGNGASIYTQSGYNAREFKLKANAGMLGINVGIPAPVAFLPFGGAKDSQWADIKTQGKAIVRFYTQDKIITERYWE